MSLGDVMTLVAASIVALGGGGVLVLALSSWLGKVWAERLMESARAAHEQSLEALRSSLHRDNETVLSQLRTHLDVAKEKHLSGHDDKIRIYRLVVEVVSDLLADFDRHSRQALPPDQAAQSLDRFNRGRMKAYGYLAMLAPQTVMDAADVLFDDLMLVSNGTLRYEWPRIRAHILRLLNSVRADIGFDATPIEYKGVL
ncbi:MAG: hypothetical protein AABY95_01285 [Pseudomonadota bacterium]